MLKLRRINHLAARLGVITEFITAVANEADGLCENLVLLDPQKPEKPREVLNVLEPLRTIQLRIYRRLLLPALAPSDSSHGGIVGRHIKSNITPHLKSAFAFATDISDFYPSIHHSRVYRLFVGPLGCSPDVSRVLTRLCTQNHHLALGLITSPIIADQILKPVDMRISAMCDKLKLVYTRFVDDITISGSFPLDVTSGVPDLVVRILAEHGFGVRVKKHRFGAVDRDFTITSLRYKNGRIDVSKTFIDSIQDQIADAHRIAKCERPLGLYYTQCQIRGRVEFAAWVNHGRRRDLLRRFRSVPWDRVAENAAILGLQVARRKLVPSPVKNPAE